MKQIVANGALLGLGLLLLSCSHQQLRKPTQTIYLEFIKMASPEAEGSREHAVKLLTGGECFTVSQATDRCHRFRELFKDDPQTVVPGSSLMRVRVEPTQADAPRAFSVLVFKGERDKWEPHANPGRFQIPSEEEWKRGDRDISESRFTHEMVEILKALSFK